MEVVVFPVVACYTSLAPATCDDWNSVIAVGRNVHRSAFVDVDVHPCVLTLTTVSLYVFFYLGNIKERAPNTKRGEKKVYIYAVALEADEVHRHRDGAVAVPVQGLDVVEEVREELVAAFEHTEGHDVVPPHFLHDISGKPLSPEVGREREREREREDGQLSFLPVSSISSFLFVCFSRRSFHFSHGWQLNTATAV